jgi:hypothetical protein
MKQEYDEQEQERKEYLKDQLMHEIRLARFNIERAQAFSTRGKEHLKAADDLQDALYGTDDADP